ncbi:MAG: hypothetical protein ACT4OV_10830 [Microthrixaceae bacterium]
MPGDANPLDDAADAAVLAGAASALVDAVDAALPGWVVGSVRRRWLDWRQTEPEAALLADAAAAAAQARATVVPRLRSLLATDVDAQRTNPLALIREAVAFPTRVLLAAGVPPVVRDADAERLFPEDSYDLAPASFADLAPAVHEPGVRWGAAKAHVVLRRRRRSG